MNLATHGCFEMFLKRQDLIQKHEESCKALAYNKSTPDIDSINLKEALAEGELIRT